MTADCFVNKAQCNGKSTNKLFEKVWKKKVMARNYEVYLPQNGLSLSSEEAEKPPPHTRRLLSLTPGAGTMKTHAQQV